MQNPAAGRVLFRKFTVPYPDFAYGIHSSSKARKCPEQFLRHMRHYAGDKELLACPLAVTFEFHIPKGKRKRDLDQLVEDCLNAYKGHLFEDDIQVVEIHAFRVDQSDSPRFEICIERLRDQTKVTQNVEQLRRAGLTPDTLRADDTFTAILAAKGIAKG